MILLISRQEIESIFLNLYISISLISSNVVTNPVALDYNIKNVDVLLFFIVEEAQFLQGPYFISSLLILLMSI